MNHGSHTLATLAVLACAMSAPSAAQPVPRAGPVIRDFGPVYDIVAPTFSTPTNRAYRLVFEVALAPADSTAPNERLITVARFLNMHARAGVPRDSLEAAVVIHGPAARAALRDDTYMTRFGVGNPDLRILQALHEAGVRVILCGQSSMSRGFYPDLLAPQVELALSAMTALTVLQQDGYVLNPF
ncbi:MAG: DsrE family protein [Gemmatimonadota bacterium]|nr:DsrE family protein [Gemmatimonadota bacterium]MDH4350463.1 DsrE family protein [Gemmatimonadota bacterium]MDH5197187.1 DsrE family protein [Gemmatimonadota bacterium]